MSKKWILVMSFFAVILLGLVIVGPIMSNVEQPSYAVVTHQDNIEIRQYPPMLIAEVTVSGTREEAVGDGFRLLADFIFGNNSVAQGIAMTAPVQQQVGLVPDGQAISMTAPVQQILGDNGWRVSFVMPAEYSLATLPRPNNQRVVIKPIAARKYGTITFSGTSSNENISKYETELRAFLSAQGLESAAPPTYAFYNPPWTLPMMRRNEVLIELR